LGAVEELEGVVAGCAAGAHNAGLLKPVVGGEDEFVDVVAQLRWKGQEAFAYIHAGWKPSDSDSKVAASSPRNVGGSRNASRCPCSINVTKRVQGSRT